MRHIPLLVGDLPLRVSQPFAPSGGARKFYPRRKVTDHTFLI